MSQDSDRTRLLSTGAGSAPRARRLRLIWLASVAAALAVLGGLLLLSRIVADRPGSPDPGDWRVSYPAFCRCIREGIEIRTSPDEPIRWGATFLGIENTALRFDLPDPVGPDGRSIPIRFWPGDGTDFAAWQEDVTAWKAVPRGTRVVFTAHWDGVFSYDTLTDPKHWQPYLILRNVKLVAGQ